MYHHLDARSIKQAKQCTPVDRETYKMLQILKQQYTPSDQEVDLGAFKNYNTVRACLIWQGKISTWLDNFNNAYLAI